MLNKLSLFVRNHFSIISAVIFFSLVGLLTCINKIGIIEDGVHHFWEVLTAGNIWVGHEGFLHFPYNSRYFPSILSHLGTGLAVKAGILNIALLLYIFTFLSYISPLIFLVIIYLNIPSGKKRYFDIILLSFLSCFIFMFYQIWGESLATSLFLWIVFVIYFYNDFEKLSCFNLVSLNVFSFALISSHPMSAVFIPLLLFIGIKKHLKTAYSSAAAKTAVLLSFIFLLCAFVFNIYYIIYPIFPSNDYFNFYKVFKNVFFMRMVISIGAILAVSVYSREKYSKLSLIITVAALINIFDNFIFDTFSSYGYLYRPVSFYFALFFMAVSLIIKEFNCSQYVKWANLLIMILLLINCIQYSTVWNNYLKNTKDHLLQEGKITIFYKSNVDIAISQKNFFKLHHTHLHPFVLLVIAPLYGNRDINYEIDIISSNIKQIHFYNQTIKHKKENLKPFGIDTDRMKIFFKEEIA